MNESIFAQKKTMVFYFLLMVFLGACSDTPSNRPLYQGYPNSPAMTSVENELKSAALACESLGNCPENVGMIYSRENLNPAPKPQTLQCTGFLVQQNIVATNSHCIPDIIKQNPASCRSFMAIKFIRRGRGQVEIFPCQRILNYSAMDQTKISPDYAFFEIAPTGIAPLNISQEGAANRQSLRVVKIIPTEQGGRFQTESCVSALNSALNFTSASPWSKTAVAVNCHSAHGNSGSPVLNKNNQVIGILQSAYQEKQLQEIKNQAPVGTQLPDRLIPHFIWTNLACVPHPLSGRYEKEKCDAVENLRITDCVHLDLTTASADETKVNAEWTARLPRHFIYEFQTDVAQQLKRAVPRCVKADSPEKILLMYPGEIKFTTPLNFDGEFRLVRKTSFVKKSESMWQVNLVKFGEGWKGSIASSQLHLPACTPEEEKQGSTIKIVEGPSSAPVLNNNFSTVNNRKEVSLCSRD